MNRQEARRAMDALARGLLDLAERDEYPRCAGYPDGSPWLSEDYDERELAAGLCTGCPLFEACDRAATTNRVTFGIWAGRDRTKGLKGREND